MIVLQNTGGQPRRKKKKREMGPGGNKVAGPLSRLSMGLGNMKTSEGRACLQEVGVNCVELDIWVRKREHSTSVG